MSTARGDIRELVTKLRLNCLPAFGLNTRYIWLVDRQPAVLSIHRTAVIGSMFGTSAVFLSVWESALLLPRYPRIPYVQRNVVLLLIY
jgi:hypothetical protein